MPGRPLPLMRRVAQLVLAVLLLAPLLAGAHVHGFGHDASPACSVCTIAKHAPAVVGTPVATAPIVYRPLALAALPLEARCVGRCWRPSGRAPPFVLAGRVT
jgi:hypothetical protein